MMSSLFVEGMLLKSADESCLPARVKQRRTGDLRRLNHHRQPAFVRWICCRRLSGVSRIELHSGGLTPSRALLNPVSPPVMTTKKLQDAFLGIARQYHKNPLVKCSAGTKPFSIISPLRTPKLVSERTPLKPSTSKLSTYKILGPDIILLKNYVSLKDQADIVNICQKWGMVPGGFCESTELQLHMMCFGRNWDPVTGYENHCRSDGSEPPPLPHELISLAEAAVQDAQAHLNELPSMRPDIFLVKFYSSYDRLDLHQDCDESSDSLERGLPVVSISIGEMAEFVYGNTRDKKKLKSVLLKSGDVLIFGGKSRLMYHGVPQIAQYTSPIPLLRETELIGGRLSLTFRQI